MPSAYSGVAGVCSTRGQVHNLQHSPLAGSCIDLHTHFDGLVQGQDGSSQAADAADSLAYGAFVQAANAAQMIVTRLEDTPDADAAVR